MLTLSYGALIGLLLASFVLGLIFPFLLIIYFVLNDKIH